MWVQVLLTATEFAVESTYDTSFLIHLVIYGLLAAIITYLLLQKSYKPRTPTVLTASEIQECIDAWSPKPFELSLTEEDEFDLQSIQLVEKAQGNFITVNGKDKINCSSCNFLGFTQNPDIEKAAVSSLRKYGCGSCGPRQFYGTIDVHLDFEDKFAKFLNTESALLYASGFATATSVISLYATRLDYIICDEGVKESIQMGNYLSRSNVKYFKHNDMGHLRQLVENTVKSAKSKKIRGFIIVEGIYQQRGTICPLPEIVAIAKEFKFRIILDDSVGLGSLGKTGRGIVEHYGLDMQDIDIYIADISMSFGTIGGVCASAQQSTNFQKINSSGYVFSASNPPYLTTTAIEAMNQIDSKPEVVHSLQQNAVFLRKRLTSIPEIEVEGSVESPLIFIRLKDRTGNRYEDNIKLQAVVDEALNNGVAITRQIFHKTQKFVPEASIRIGVMATHTIEQLETVATVIENAVRAVSQKNNNNF